jgi:hypothetical protein
MPRFPVLRALLLLATSPLFAAADREASRAAVMIPVAGTVAGANGTRFQTDLTITNQTSGAGGVLVDVYWLPRDVPGSGTPVKRLALAPWRVEFYEDFVTRTLNLSGLGAIAYRPGRWIAEPCRAHRRIRAPVDAGTGTGGNGLSGRQCLYAVFPPTDDFQPIPGRVYGLRQDANFRSNYGLVNMSSKPLTFIVSFFTGSSGTVNEQTRSELVTVSAQSMTQRAVPEQMQGQLMISMVADQERSLVNPTAPLQAWAAYGSSVDNITGDGWYSKGQASYPHNEQ